MTQEFGCLIAEGMSQHANLRTYGEALEGHIYPIPSVKAINCGIPSEMYRKTKIHPDCKKFEKYPPF